MTKLDFTKAVIDPDMSEAALAIAKMLPDTGVRLRYGELAMLVQPEAIEQARKAVAALAASERAVIQASTRCALDKFIAKAEKKRKQSKWPSKKDSDNLFHDMCLWYVLTRIWRRCQPWGARDRLHFHTPTVE